MTTYRLDSLLAPRSITVVGASPREHSVGRKVLANLTRGGFAGPIRLVNPRHAEVGGIPSVGGIDRLPPTDLLVVTAPAAEIPGIVETAGSRGCGAAVIISAGLGQGPGSPAEQTLQAARKFGVRLLGPNCLGLQVPRLGLDASFAAHLAMPGQLALVSQSGAIAAGLVEWAARRSVGFSAVISLGNQLDVDFGDLLDYFAADPATAAIVLYIESVQDAPKFLSAARAAARSKPVIVIKAGRHAEGAAAARTHTGALAGADAVYDAAFRRVGLLRALDLDELFDAAETLGRVRPFAGDRLAILTNGGGLGVLAVDRLRDLGGRLAPLGAEALAALDASLPPLWSRSNPVDIIGDADAGRYVAALDAVLTDPCNDALLVINVPTALAPAGEAAVAVASAVQRYRDTHPAPKPVFAVWIGDDGEAEARLRSAGIPHYPSEADAVRGFMHLVRYREGLDALMAPPQVRAPDSRPDTARAQAIARRAVQAGRHWLDPMEIAEVLACYEIPFATVLFARDAEEAGRLARPLLEQGPVVVKIRSADIVHKSDVGGVRLNLVDDAAVRQATQAILDSARAAKPQARIDGVTIHPMIVRQHARELIAGIANDATFGPVILFGSGGTAVEVVNDKALALPPLDIALAKDLIGRTRVVRRLHAYRDVPAADLDAVAGLLVRLGELAADIPEIAELDLNPLLATPESLVALDARIAVAQPTPGWRGHPSFAIRPYPKAWERQSRAHDGTPLLVRPVRPEDERLYPAFLAKVAPEHLRQRFFGSMKELSQAAIAAFTQIDYARAMAFVVLREASDSMLAVARLHMLTHGDIAEFAVLVRSDLHGQGLGWLLMQTLIDYARAEGIKEIVGEVLADNRIMLQLCQELGFSLVYDTADPKGCTVRLRLEPAA